jgi:hypothetical protein
VNAGALSFAATLSSGVRKEIIESVISSVWGNNRVVSNHDQQRVARAVDAAAAGDLNNPDRGLKEEAYRLLRLIGHYEARPQSHESTNAGALSFAAALDDFEKKHLETWLDRVYGDRRADRADAKRRILAAVKNDPSLKDMGWPSVDKATTGFGSTAPKEAGNMAETAKTPSLDERVEAMVAKCMEATAKHLETMMAKYTAKPDKEGHEEPDGDEGGAMESEGEKPEAMEEKDEKKEPKPETAAARGPDAALPPAVSSARPGETFQSALTKAERDELASLRAWVDKRQKQENAETFASRGVAELKAAGIDVDESYHAELRTEAFESGERGVKARVSAIVGHHKRLAAARPTEPFVPYGLAALSGGAGPRQAQDDPELKRAYDLFGARPEARLAIDQAYREYHARGDLHTPFSVLVSYDDRINPSARGAPRGGVDRTQGGR